jgi:GTP pyrophosphokinase
MKTGLMSEGAATAPIVALLDAGTAHSNAEVVRARAFAEPLLSAELLDTGENALAHADGVAAILHGVGAAQELQAAAYLVYAGDFLNKPEEVVARAFGDSHASLVMHTRRLVQLQRAARDAKVQTDRRADVRAEQTERVRKMLLAFSRDLRVVLLRLASRLQTLRWYAASKQPCPRELADESQAVFAPLANRLGIWQIKWELEDLAFRFREPEAYKALAKALHETRVERERRVEAARAALQADLHSMGLAAEVQGRPKHLYSIHKKMRCASSSPAWPTAMRRWRGRMRSTRRYPASSTTTSPSPRPTATSRCTPSCWARTAARWKCRSARARCTSTPSMA